MSSLTGRTVSHKAGGAPAPSATPLINLSKDWQEWRLTVDRSSHDNDLVRHPPMEKADSVKQIKDTFRLLREREEELLRQVDQNIVKEESITQVDQIVKKESTAPITQFIALLDVRKVCTNFQLSTGIRFRWTDPAFPCSVPHEDVKRPKSTEINFASWNIDNLVDKKVDTKDVVDALCMVIDSRSFDVVAIQELGDSCLPETLCRELNKKNSTKKWVYSVSKELGKGTHNKTELGAFLWDLKAGVECERVHSLEMERIVPDKPQSRIFTRHPFVGSFKMNSQMFTVISMHIKAKPLQNDLDRRTEVENESLPYVIDRVKQDCPYGTVILLGDFNMSPESPCFEPLVKRGYKNIVDENTNISAKKEQGSHCYDHIWYDQHLDLRQSSVRAKQHLKLKDGEFVSNHCPVTIKLKAAAEKKGKKCASA